MGGTFLPNVNIVLQLTGSFGGTIVCVVLPVIFYHKAYAVAREQEEFRYTKQPDWKRNFASYVIFALGISIGSVGFAETINDLM